MISFAIGCWSRCKVTKLRGKIGGMEFDFFFQVLESRSQVPILEMMDEFPRSGIMVQEGSR